MTLKPVINATETVGSVLLLVDIRPFYEYIQEDGKQKRTDKELGYTYSCVALEKRFEKFPVKIEQNRPLFPNAESIPDNTQVNFTNLTGTLYVKNSGSFSSVAISFKADNIEVVEDE